MLMLMCVTLMIKTAQHKNKRKCPEYDKNLAA